MKAHGYVPVGRRRESVNSERSLKAAALQPLTEPLPSDDGGLENGWSRPSPHNLSMQP